MYGSNMHGEIIKILYGCSQTAISLQELQTINLSIYLAVTHSLANIHTHKCVTFEAKEPNNSARHNTF